VESFANALETRQQGASRTDSDRIMPEKRRITSLDGLRGAGLLMVFLYHYLPPNPANIIYRITRLNWIAVDLFFVLSGFLITGILFDSRGKTGALKKFLKRRFWRLMPVYLAAIFVVMLASFALRVKPHWADLPFLLYGANFIPLLVHGTGTVGNFICCLHFWSLATEEQFYIVWPLIILFTGTRTSLLRICCFGMVCAFLFRCWMFHLDLGWDAIYYPMVTRMDSLLAGSIMALLLRGPNARSWQNRRFLTIGAFSFGSTLIALMAFERHLFPMTRVLETFGYTLDVGLCFCIVSLARQPDSFIGAIGNLGLFQFFGRYSYSFYVWHYLPQPFLQSHLLPTFRSAFTSSAIADLCYAAFLLPIFTCIAMVSYKYLEAPFLGQSKVSSTSPNDRYKSALRSLWNETSLRFSHSVSHMGSKLFAANRIE
jgi:peptidoglycan/LPS O-acetylase OafA/YrhL